jgi:hypothetical protein
LGALRGTLPICKCLIPRFLSLEGRWRRFTK